MGYHAGNADFGLIGSLLYGSQPAGSELSLAQASSRQEPGARLYLASRVLTIYTNHLGENLVHKLKTVKFDVVERTTHHNVYQNQLKRLKQ